MLLLNCYLKKNIVYIPTLARVKTGGYLIVEPISVVPASDTAGLRNALKAAVTREMLVVPSFPPREQQANPAILKYAHEKSYSAFVRGASAWHVDDRDGVYRIFPQKKGQPRGWVDDIDRMVEFPPGTAVDEVCDRLVSMMQAAPGVA
jgi:hypothetical protein